MGMGLELDEGLRLVVLEEEPDSWRSKECPFTVEPGADGLPAGALLDMGRTLGRDMDLVSFQRFPWIRTLRMRQG